MDNQNLQRGLYYDPSAYEIFGEIQNVNQNLNAMGMGIKSDFEKLGEQISFATRKKRRKMCREQLGKLQNGEIVLVATYDDGTQEIAPFITNQKGEFCIYKIHTAQSSTAPKWYGIFFRISGQWIFLEKLQPRHFYEKFIKAGVEFVSGKSQEKIGRLLFEAFAPKLEATEEKLIVNGMAGWNNGEFYTMHNFPFAKNAEFADMPVMRKKFEAAKMTEKTAESYFREMQCIPKWEDRLMIMLFPFAGILSSIMEEEGNPWDLCINIISLGKVSGRQICGWLQIFNRENLVPHNVDVNEKEFDAMLANCKDELFIADFRIRKSETAYQKAKRQRRMGKCIDIMTGKYGLPGLGGKRVCAGFVSLADELCFEPGVYNIVLSQDDHKKDTMADSFLEGKVMEAIFSGFISYVKNNWEGIWTNIRKAKVRSDSRIAPLYAVMDIVQDFWKSEGIDFQKFAGCPERIDFLALFEGGCYKVEELQDVFIQAIRGEAGNYYFVHRKAPDTKEAAILYDEKYIWFPPDVLSNIAKSTGLSGELRKILLQMKMQNLLETDEEGLTRKLQRNGIRKEFYQFRREVFQEVGKIDIVKLGKEWGKNA